MKFRDQYRTVLRSEAIEIAQRVLRAEGDAALTMRRVSTELGLSPSAIYRYFDSRDDLVAAVWQRRLADVGGRLTPPSRPGDGPAAIDVVVATWVDAGGRDPQALLRIADQLDQVADDDDPPTDQGALQLTAPLVDALQSAAPATRSAPPARSSNQAAVILRTIAAVCAQGDAEPPDARLAQRAVGALLEVWAEP